MWTRGRLSLRVRMLQAHRSSQCPMVPKWESDAGCSVFFSVGSRLEAHPKLRPVESLTAGVFLAGVAQGPKDIPETVSQASDAAAKVLQLFSRDEMTQDPTVAYVVEELCSGCGVCVEICPHEARELELVDVCTWDGAYRHRQGGSVSELRRLPGSLLEQGYPYSQLDAGGDSGDDRRCDVVGPTLRAARDGEPLVGPEDLAD